MIDEKLQLVPVGSLVHNTFYSIGGDETKFGEKLCYDVLTFHQDYIASDLKFKVIKNMQQKYKDFRLLKSNMQENQVTKKINGESLQVILGVDFLYQNQYNIQLIFMEN